jgi:hypothetical protein
VVIDCVPVVGGRGLRGKSEEINPLRHVHVLYIFIFSSVKIESYGQ